MRYDARGHIEGMLEDTKEVIKSRKSRKNRQHNGQRKNDKQRSTNHTHKTTDRVTRTPPFNVNLKVSH
jgi:hypothetical protein